MCACILVLVSVCMGARASIHAACGLRDPRVPTTLTTGYLSFHLMAQCAVHALKGLAYRARVTLASSPASHCKQCSARAAAPVLLAHAEVTIGSKT